MKQKYSVTCIECKKRYILEIDPNDLAKYQTELDIVGGIKVQDAFPYLTPNERELIVSGMCGKCYDELFNETEES